MIFANCCATSSELYSNEKKIVKSLTCSGVSGNMTSFHARLYSPLVRVQGSAILSARACNSKYTDKE